MRVDMALCGQLACSPWSARSSVASAHGLSAAEVVARPAAAQGRVRVGRAPAPAGSPPARRVATLWHRRACPSCSACGQGWRRCGACPGDPRRAPARSPPLPWPLAPRPRHLCVARCTRIQGWLRCRGVVRVLLTQHLAANTLACSPAALACLPRSLRVLARKMAASCVGVLLAVHAPVDLQRPGLQSRVPGELAPRVGRGGDVAGGTARVWVRPAVHPRHRPEHPAPVPPRPRRALPPGGVLGRGRGWFPRRAGPPSSRGRRRIRCIRTRAKPARIAPAEPWPHARRTCEPPWATVFFARRHLGPARDVGQAGRPRGSRVPHW